MRWLKRIDARLTRLEERIARTALATFATEMVIAGIFALIATGLALLLT